MKNMDLGPVILVIKAPNQKYDDQTINCFLNWTVDKLKTHISHVYPSKPVSRLWLTYSEIGLSFNFPCGLFRSIMYIKIIGSDGV